MISKYEISAAKREAADAEEAQAYLEQVISDNIGLTERNKQLIAEISAANRRIEELKLNQMSIHDRMMSNRK